MNIKDKQGTVCLASRRQKGKWETINEKHRSLTEMIQKSKNVSVNTKKKRKKIPVVIPFNINFNRSSWNGSNTFRNETSISSEQTNSGTTKTDSFGRKENFVKASVFMAEPRKQMWALSSSLVWRTYDSKMLRRSKDSKSSKPAPYIDRKTYIEDKNMRVRNIPWDRYKQAKRKKEQ